tara:strand:+ start:775486 stop:776439 length:954 start_codon:yes stop_codon:yes gene_type:complete
MSFNDKINICFQNYTQIDNPNYVKNKYTLYADFIELIAVFSNADGVSFGDVQDRFFGTKDYNNAKERDKDESWLGKVFTFIQERANVFGLDYAFNVDDDNLITLKSDLSWKNKLYIGMLISSKLNVFSEFKSDITTEFESISFEVLKEFLPSHAITKEFGKNSPYQGNAIKKISSLAKDIGLKTDDYELSGISERNYQERGLDIIGWIPFSDSCMNKLIYLAQCACGKDVESKHHDTRRFENYFIYYKTSPQHIMMIPYSLINTTDKKFYNSDLLEKEFLIFERKRILTFFNNEDVFKSLQMSKIVEACVLIIQDIV